MSDDTAYVQGFIDRGELIPAGVYYCPGGIEVPADYIERAKAAGRMSSGGKWPLGASLDGPHGVRCNWRHGGWMILGSVSADMVGEPEKGTAPMKLGGDDYAFYIAGPPAFMPADFSAKLGGAPEARNRRPADQPAGL